MSYAQADYLRVPLLDGSFGVAQIFEIPAAHPECVFLGLSDRKALPDTDVSPFLLSDVIAFAFCSDRAIRSGQWSLAGFDQIPRFRGVFDFDKVTKSDLTDHPIHDPAVIEAFMSAVHGLYPWDSFGDLFDHMKRPDVARPAQAIDGATP